MNFVLPAQLRATEPPEARGLTRDGVRMMVAYRSERRLQHCFFHQLPAFLGPDDLLVVNTSATLPAAVSGHGLGTEREVVVHFSTKLSARAGGDEYWAVEVRRPTGGTSRRWAKEPTRSGTGGDGPPPAVVDIGHGARVELLGPYQHSTRLWTALVRAPSGVVGWLNQHGQPIRYDYVTQEWPLSYYQNVFSDQPGSAEMPSAGRPFSARTVLELVTKGVGLAPIVLHTGVSSLEPGELPYPERVHVPISTARRINDARQAGGRVVAVGTTVVRALESAFDARSGQVHDYEGWTNLVVTPTTGARAVDGALTGWHEPEASHLLMMQAIAGKPLLEAAYQASLERGYLWHEFGDVALILP